MDHRSHTDLGDFNTNFWALPNVLTPQDAAVLDNCDARVVNGLVNAIDAIDKIIAPKKTKSKSKSKLRSDRMALCDKCGTGFSSIGNLNRHNRVSHQGLRVFCDFKGCKQSFSQAADLSRHRRRVHMCFTKLEQYQKGVIRPSHGRTS